MLAILNAHLVAPGARDGAAAPGNGPEIPAQPGASQPAEPRAQPAAPDHAAVRGSTLEALLANAGVNRGAVLGRGYFGEVCRATIAGEPLVLKTYHPHAKEKQILSNERGGKPDEAIAAYLTSKTRHKDHQVNVVQPRFFLVKPLGGNEHRMVDPLELRALLKEGKRQKITWECVGLLMPEAKGGELRGLLQQGTLTEQNKRQVLKGTLEAVMKLNARGFIHRDLKPTNLFFDPASGKTTLIDTGLMHKTSKNRPETLFLKSGAGTPTYKHPRVGRADHGTETDLYATAMMALELAHGKKGRELASELSFRADATGGAEALSESLKRILHKTDNKGQLLQDPAGNLIPTEDFKAIQLSMQDKTSLASLALACLEQADKPAKEWAHTANAQWIYADLLRHPSLQES
jgi:serine/threonine protein kinase